MIHPDIIKALDEAENRAYMPPWWTHFRALLDELMDLQEAKEELRRAIHRLPRPPDAIGDGPDERVRWILDQHKKLVAIAEAAERYIVAHADAETIAHSHDYRAAGKALESYIAAWRGTEEKEEKP